MLVADFGRDAELLPINRRSLLDDLNGYVLLLVGAANFLFDGFGVLDNSWEKGKTDNTLPVSFSIFKFIKIIKFNPYRLATA